MCRKIQNLSRQDSDLSQCPESRDDVIDIMKGLLIILMVAGHAQIPIHRFIYLFHMSAFFMITGWLFNYNIGIVETLTEEFKINFSYIASLANS